MVVETKQPCTRVVWTLGRMPSLNLRMTLKAWVMNQSAGRGADHVMEMAGSSAAAELGLELLATGGADAGGNGVSFSIDSRGP